MQESKLGALLCFFSDGVLDLLDVGEPEVYGLPHVIEGGRAQDDAARAQEAGGRKHPQEEAVQHHGAELPVLNLLQH